MTDIQQGDFIDEYNEANDVSGHDAANDDLSGGDCVSQKLETFIFNIRQVRSGSTWRGITQIIPILVSLSSKISQDEEKTGMEISNSSDDLKIVLNICIISIIVGVNSLLDHRLGKMAGFPVTVLVLYGLYGTVQLVRTLQLEISRNYI